MDERDPKSVLDFGDWLSVDAQQVARPVVHPLTWHDFSCLRTNEGVCAWSAPRCEACNGTEIVWGTAMDPCACRGLVSLGRRLTYARIPWAYRDVSLTHLAPEGRQWVQDYRDGGDGLRLLGLTGRGKTHRMLCVVRGLCERGITARYVSWALWLDDMRQAMGRDDEMAALRARIERPIVVALDDIGRERDTDWAQSMLDQLLERRTLAGRTVLLASNLTDEGLEQHLGDRLWSRLRASTRPVVMTGKDWRASK